VSCSDGVNGVMWKYNWLVNPLFPLVSTRETRWLTSLLRNVQGDVKGFPYIGGAQAIGGWNSPNCGTCWKATFQGRSIHILAIDHTANGLNIAQAAMNDLTNGRAVELGRVEADVVQVSLGECGL